MQDMNEENLGADDQAFAEKLSALKPRGPAIERDALMFAAGRASVGKRPLWPWQMATGMSLAIAIGMLCLSAGHPLAPVRNPPIAVAPPVQPFEAVLPMSGSPGTAADSGDDFSYLRTRQNVLAMGLAALPQTAGGGSRAPLNNVRALSLWAQKFPVQEGANE